MSLLYVLHTAHNYSNQYSRFSQREISLIFTVIHITSSLTVIHVDRSIENTIDIESMTTHMTTSEGRMLDAPEKRENTKEQET